MFMSWTKKATVLKVAEVGFLLKVVGLLIFWDLRSSGLPWIDLYRCGVSHLFLIMFDHVSSLSMFFHGFLLCLQHLLPNNEEKTTNTSQNPWIPKKNNQESKHTEKHDQ